MMSRAQSSPTEGKKWYLVSLNGLDAEGAFEDIPSLLTYLRERLGGVELRDSITPEDLEGRKRLVACRSRSGRSIYLLALGEGDLEIVGVARGVMGGTTSNH